MSLLNCQTLYIFTESARIHLIAFDRRYREKKTQVVYLLRTGCVTVKNSAGVKRFVSFWSIFCPQKVLLQF